MTAAASPHSPRPTRLAGRAARRALLAAGPLLLLSATLLPLSCSPCSIEPIEAANPCKDGCPSKEDLLDPSCPYYAYVGVIDCGQGVEAFFVWGGQYYFDASGQLVYFKTCRINDDRRAGDPMLCVDYGCKPDCEADRGPSESACEEWWQEHERPQR